MLTKRIKKNKEVITVQKLGEEVNKIQRIITDVKNTNTVIDNTLISQGNVAVDYKNFSLLSITSAKEL
jgi:hypothetical protein